MSHPLDWHPLPQGTLTLDTIPLGVAPEFAAYYVLYSLLWCAAADSFVHKVDVDVDQLPDDEELDVPSKERWVINWITSKQNARNHQLEQLADFNHLVLPEYEDLLRNIEQDRNDYSLGNDCRHGTIIIGHPGIGKTRFQTFLLVRRLRAGEPTILWHPSTDKYIFFTVDGVSIHDGPSHTLRTLMRKLSIRDKDIVVLFDCNGAAKCSPPPTVWCKGWWTIHTTLPNHPGYKEWAKQKATAKYWVSPTTWSQVYVILHVMERHEPTSDAIVSARNAFCDCGPMLRPCLDAAQPTPQAYETFLEGRDRAITSLVASPRFNGLLEFHDTETSPLADSDVDKIFIAIPELPRIRHATMRPASLTACEKIVDQLSRRPDVLDASFSDVLCHSKDVWSFARMLYTAAVRRCFRLCRRLPIRNRIWGLPYKGGGADHFDPMDLLDVTNQVLDYVTLQDAAELLMQNVGHDCALIPRVKTEATFDVLRVNWVGSTVSIVLFLATAAPSHVLNTTTLHDIWNLFCNPKRSTVAEIHLRIVFVVPSDVFARWQSAMEPEEMTAKQAQSRADKGMEVYGAEHWRGCVPQYVVSVDMNDLLDVSRLSV